MKKKNIFTRKFIELTGCVHNHSVYSYDSKISINRIIKAAKLNELDYLTINDHNTFQAREDKALLKEQDLMIIVGAEINDPERNNHYLVFNTDTVITGKKVEEYVEHYKQEGAICFAAHPYEKRVSSQFRKYVWTNPEVNGFDGLEIWNFLSEWVARINPKVNGLFMVLFPFMFVSKPNRENLNYWDSLNAKGLRRSALGSVDCHQESYRKFGIKFRFLTHKATFKTIRTNVLIEDKTNINNMDILQALKEGKSYIVNYKMGIPYNFYAGIKCGDNSAVFGEEIELQEGARFYYRLPKISKIKLFHNGVIIEKQFKEKGFFEITEKGFYRLEITRWGRGWIYTNNIYVI